MFIFHGFDILISGWVFLHWFDGHYILILERRSFWAVFIFSMNGSRVFGVLFTV